MTVKKNKWSITVVAGIAAAALTLWALADKVNAFIKDKYIVPIIDCRIDDKQRFNNEKLDVIYNYTMESAKCDGKEDLWNKCVDNVRNKEQVRRIKHQ